MCMGLPMRVIECGAGSAVCEGQGERRTIDMMLVGEQTPGTWVLVVTPEQAALVGQAIEAVGLSLTGAADVDHLFPDLAGREPELPAHLKEQLVKTTG